MVFLASKWQRVRLGLGCRSSGMARLERLSPSHCNATRLSCALSTQVIGDGLGDAYIRMKLKDQHESLAMLERDPDIKGLRKITAPLVDLEVRGVPALAYFGNVVWSDVFDSMNAGAWVGLGWRVWWV